MADDDLTAKREAFALAYVETGNASKAYRTAFDVKEGTKPETVWSDASRLLANPKVAARVAELQAMARDMALVSVGTLTKELEEARSMAMTEKTPSAAISATMGKAKLHGLLVEKVEATGKDGAPLVPETSSRELAKAISYLLAKGLKAKASG
ncbi:MAG TPA: terminase small subunit [Pseudaminobacter sp.]|nr:terminase small subunit [Pseudaminobacter sp.]